MPSRWLREGILTSEKVDKLCPQAEILYRRLMSVVDDWGRYYANPALVRAACYPLAVDRVREARFYYADVENVPLRCYGQYISVASGVCVLGLALGSTEKSLDRRQW